MGIDAMQDTFHIILFKNPDSTIVLAPPGLSSAGWKINRHYLGRSMFSFTTNQQPAHHTIMAACTCIHYAGMFER